MSKLISVSNVVYGELLKLKGGEKSFSSVIMQLIEKRNGKGDIMRFAGSLKGDKELATMKRMLKQRRQAISARKFKGI